MLLLLLLPLAVFLPPQAWAGEIIGGQEARPHSRPYMAFVNIEAGGGGGGRCGGFLIREDVVVTAVHCNCNLGSITMLLGAHNIVIKEPGRQEIRVRRRIQHPDYNDETDENDIMLLQCVSASLSVTLSLIVIGLIISQLKRKAKLTNWVKTIPPPRTNKKVKPGANYSVTSWGWTSADSEQTSDTLQEVDVVVMPDAACWRTPNGPYKNYKPSTILCAGDPDEGKNPSKGDSGGPLVCGGTAQGIVSYGFSDGTPPPIVYTRVSTFVPWIEKTMKKLHP